MKMSTLFLKILALVIVALMLASCSKEMLVTKKAIRNLDLVKVGAPDPQFEKRKGSVTEPLKISEAVAEAELTDEASLAESSVPEKKVAVARSSETLEQLASLVMNIANIESNARSFNKNSVEQPVRSLNPVKRAERLMNRGELSEKKSAGSSINLVKLILYLLIALLVIMILDLILPGRLVTIIILVLLIVALLYLLGGL